MKNLIIIAAILLFSIKRINAQSVPPKSMADLAWARLTEKPSNFDGDDLYTNKKEKEISNRKYLEEGFKFWNQFPLDQRKYEWFENATTYRAPFFWLNIDEGAKGEASFKSYYASLNWRLYNMWKNRLAKIRKSYINGLLMDREKRLLRLRSGQLRKELNRSMNFAYRGTKEQFVKKLKILIYDAFYPYARKDYYSTESIQHTLESIFCYAASYGLSLEDLSPMISNFTNSRNPNLKKWASKKRNLITLTTIPFELKHSTINGEVIDLGKLRGKVVLLDFWATTCTACINRMPVIKHIYEKYKDQGFIVISAAKNTEKDKERIVKIHSKIGADWPVMILDGDVEKPDLSDNNLGNQIWKKYGFKWVPQLLLLDKQGRLAEYNGDLFNGDFEPLIQRLLTK